MKSSDRDTMIQMAMIGAFLTTYAEVRGYARVIEGVGDSVNDIVSKVEEYSPAGLLKAGINRVREELL